jgi:hypothetical protein
MIHENIVNLFRQLLQQAQPPTWLVVDDFRNDLGHLILVFRLNAIQYKTMMISSGILRRRGNDDTVNSYLPLELQGQLKPDINQTSQYKLLDVH